MEKRIELEKRGKDAADIKELNLDNCRSTSIVGLTDEFCNLESLSLINVGLTSLKGFPRLPNLKKLELSDNRIVNGLNILATSPKLSHLNLSGNRIKDLETLKPLQDFKSLRNLDLFNNEATMMDDYRERVFRLIPSLKFLDGYDAEEQEVESDADEEVNGNDDDSDEERNDEEGTSDEDEEEEYVGLNAVYSENLDEMTDEGDYEAGEEEEEEDGIEEEEEEGDEENETAEEQTRGKKRKHEDESEGN